MFQATSAGPAGGPDPLDRPIPGQANGHPGPGAYGAPAGHTDPAAGPYPGGGTGYPGQAANGSPAGGPEPTAGPYPGRADGYPVQAADGDPAVFGHRPSAVEGAGGIPGTRAADGHAAGGPHAWPGQAAGRPAGAQEPAQAVGGFLPGAGDSHAAVMLEYLRGSRDMVQAQRDVLLGYLGSAAQAAARAWVGAEPVAYYVGHVPVLADQAPALPGRAPAFAEQGRILAAPDHSSAAPVPALGADWPGNPGAAGQDPTTGPRRAGLHDAYATPGTLADPGHPGMHDAATANGARPDGLQQATAANGPWPEALQQATTTNGRWSGGTHHQAAATGSAADSARAGGPDPATTTGSWSGGLPDAAPGTPTSPGHPDVPNAAAATALATGSGVTSGPEAAGRAGLGDPRGAASATSAFVPGAAPVPDAFGHANGRSPLSTANGSLPMAGNPAPAEAGHALGSPGPWPPVPAGEAPAEATPGGTTPAGTFPAEATPADPTPTGPLQTGTAPGSAPADGDPSAAPAGGSARSAEEVMDVIVEIVHTRTGYPRDMLDPELDLEADLSIDSIKRVEIIGALADRIGLPQDPGGGSADSAVEELSRIKTLRGIVDWVTAHTAPPAAAEPASPAAAPSAERLASVSRLRVDLLPLPATQGDPETLRGLRIGIVGDGAVGGDSGTDTDGPAVAPALTAALRSHGADVRQLDAPEAGFDAVLDLSGLRPGALPVLPEAFPALQRTLTGGVQRLLLVTANGAVPGAGLHGFARSAALEFPGRLIRAVDVHPKEDPERIAAQLVAELTCTASEFPEESGSAEDPGPASVGYTAQGVRVARRPVPAPLVPADGRPLLGPDSVVLLTGGARGITARTALALARVTGCHVELMGRTPQPPAEADEFGYATDRAALRAALIATGLRTPAEIEAAASRILAEREVRDTLSALGEVAASVRYHCADVTDEQAVRVVVAGVRERHGRLDGIVHGAGTLRDGLLHDKQPAAFAEVFTTKVTGARHLAVAAAQHGTAPAPRFLALFGSVAGVYGNRGQTDYAAANDALDCLAHTWAESFPGRVLSVDWGPWAAEAGGMVSPELARAYAKRGIPLIEPEAGTDAFLAELSHGTDVQVVLMAEGSGERGGRG